jgi:hypothetical protein
MTGHNPDVGLSFFRQTAPASEPVLNPFRTRIVGGCGKTKVSELALEVSQKLRGFWNCLDCVKGISKPSLDCRSWHKLGHSLGAGGAHGAKIEPAFLPNQSNQEYKR